MFGGSQVDVIQVVLIESSPPRVTFLPDSGCVTHPVQNYFYKWLSDKSSHIGIISTKCKLPKDDIQQILDVLNKNIETIPESRWWNHYTKAEKLIGKKDPKDVPFIAVAFALTVDGIWSNDRDFESQSLFKVWKTTELALNLGFL